VLWSETNHAANINAELVVALHKTLQEHLTLSQGITGSWDVDGQGRGSGDPNPSHQKSDLRDFH